VTPRDRTTTGNRLTLHWLEWGDDDGPVVLLLHGFLEHAHAWHLVGPRLAAAGYRAAALDLRGHGDSGWVGAGGYYHFADYASDVAFVVRALGGRVALVGHSMGATAAMLWAGTEPERVRGLVLVDGLGPPDMGMASAPQRFATWIGDLERASTRTSRPITLDQGTVRLAERFARFPPDVVRHMAVHGSREVEGGRAWKFDPLHQTTSPQPFLAAQAEGFWRRITCPVLYVEGAESPLRLEPAETDRRLAILRARRVAIPGSGHHPHLERPDAFCEALVTFLARL
jgi:pimeloyl-ACP methyl ester carboxylesterase